MAPSADAIKTMASQDGLARAMAIRTAVEAGMSAFDSNISWPEGMRESSHQIESLDGTIIEVRRFLPKSWINGDKASERAVVQTTGGGMIAGSIEVFRKLIAGLVDQAGTQFFVPEWRRAPENPYPAGVEDVYATVVWLQSNATQFGLDPARIILAGQSAGGGVAAGVALMARDRKLAPPLAAQCLRSPMLDDRTVMDPSSPIFQKLTWTMESNDLGWNLYLSGRSKGK
jgi:acetyl esterase/lipase